MANYRRDYIGHFATVEQANRPCTHACCRGMRPHPENWPVHLPSRQLRSASDEQLQTYYAAHSGDSAGDAKARDQVLYEMQRRDVREALREEAEERRRVRYSASRRDRAAVLENEYVKAEDATNGFMLNRRGLEAHIEPRSLFTGPESRARKYASEELMEYWEHNPRPTQAMFEGADTRIGYSGASIASLGVRRRITTQEQYWRDQYDREQYDRQQAAAGAAVSSPPAAAPVPPSPTAAAAPRRPEARPGRPLGAREQVKPGVQYELSGGQVIESPNQPGSSSRPSWPMTPEEGRLTDRLSRGEAVKNGPGACARPGCYHAKVWHEHLNRRRPCERCDCPGFTTNAGAEPVPSAPPRRSLLSAEDEADPFAFIERSTG